MYFPRAILEFNACQRLDITIRLLFIDYFYGKNKQGYDLYKKILSNIRFPLTDDNKKIKIKNFENLITSFEKKNFNDKYKITISKEGYLANDGAHRLACAIYFNISDIPFQLTSEKINYCNWYSLNWLKENSINKMTSFSKLEVDCILHFHSYWIKSLFFYNIFNTTKNYFYFDTLDIKKNLTYLMNNNYIPKNSAEFFKSLTSNLNNLEINNNQYLINENDICKCSWLNEARRKYV